MNSKHFVPELAIALLLTISMDFMMSAEASEPICYLQTSEGKQVDLTGLCERQISPTPTVSQTSNPEKPTGTTGNSQMTPTTSSNNKAEIGRIDPKTPVNIPVVLLDKPPEWWYSLPDLPSPPVKGPTANP